ncbi:MAG: ABC transporter ATP-binding protein [Steroidobacter sp.]
MSKERLITTSGFTSVFAYGKRAMQLVWSTNKVLSSALAAMTIIAGILPAAIALIGSRIVDSVVRAAQSPTHDAHEVIRYVIVEAVLVAMLAATQRGLSLCQSLLRAQLGQRVNVMILEKALTLQLAQFEDSEFYDKLTRARREASQRPLSLVMRTFGLIQNLVSLISYATLLIQFSIWALVILLCAGLPAFIAETKFSGDAFRLFRWRSPETRMQMYLETVIAREDNAKEVKLFELGQLMLDRYRAIFKKLYKEDRDLTVRRDTWGFFLGLIGTVALYSAYAWIALSAVVARITLGQMTMYLMLFRQGQAAVSASLSAVSGLYEDNLYLSTLYEYLETPVTTVSGSMTKGAQPNDGIRFENVSFTYPGAEQQALRDITLHIRPGESLALVGDNGSGKTTLIKLLTRLYIPNSGRILLDGTDLQEWGESTLRQRICVIFQDFARYQLLLGENIGAGDVHHFDDESQWRKAAQQGMADAIISSMSAGYQTQLGKWFKDGRELSGGQWQKVALSRAFMRSRADILVLDEPTAAMDAGAEAQIFEHFQTLTRDRIAILISHRFSTVRMADQIVVIRDGRIIEHGSHTELMQLNGHYAHLFSLQAKGYQ